MLPITDMITQDIATITKVCLMDIENFILRVVKVITAQKTKLASIGTTNGRIIAVSPQPMATARGMPKLAPTIARRIEPIFKKFIKNMMVACPPN
jgi:hypothetical protein